MKYDHGKRFDNHILVWSWYKTNTKIAVRTIAKMNQKAKLGTLNKPIYFDNVEKALIFVFKEYRDGDLISESLMDGLDAIAELSNAKTRIKNLKISR